MADSKDFVAGVDSNAKKSPRRIVFITRRTSAQVKAESEDQIQTFPEVLFRAAVAIQVLAIALVWTALMFNAPLEGLADPSHTPNPAKAPWYFLGLQEMLHYFPPVGRRSAGAGAGCNGALRNSLLQSKHRSRRFVYKRSGKAASYLLPRGRPLMAFLGWFHVVVALIPTLIMVGLMIIAAQTSPQSRSGFRRYLAARRFPIG